VNKISTYRTFIVLDDAIFNNAVASLQQQIRYVNTLYPFLYILVGVIAFVVSYLLVVSRRMELATLRGLGTSPLTTFLSFFLEQSFLCLIGVGLGMVAWRAIRGPFISLHLWLILGFIGCYFVGSGLSIGIMNRRNLLAILTDKD
jgi:ABC-type antimicrobial peptide transport system permease subunit